MANDTTPSLERTTVFVRLLDEGVDVWRPVLAIPIANGQYRLLATEDYDPNVETWEFLPGVTVECESQSKGGGRVLVATRAA